MRQLPLITENVVDNEGKPGFTVRKYTVGESKPYETTNGHPNSEFSLLVNMAVVNTNIELEGVLTPSTTDTYYMTLTGLGPSKVHINGEVVYEQKDSISDPMGFLLGGVSAPLVEYSMEAGQQYEILVTSSPPIAHEGEDLGILEGKVGVRLDYMSKGEHDKDLLGEAVALAKKADYALVFTGHTTSWETEGQDQLSFNLPKDGSQDRLIAGVAAANTHTVVINSTGVAIAMPWLNKISGLLQTWFPGQEAGNSIVDVLTGKVNAEGALTCSFPKELTSAPAYGNFPGSTLAANSRSNTLRVSSLATGITIPCQRRSSTSRSASVYHTLSSTSPISKSPQSPRANGQYPSRSRTLAVSLAQSLYKSTLAAACLCLRTQSRFLLPSARHRLMLASRGSSSSP